ncbi:MAG: hypothetical protein HWE27_15185 [Gammaproteobacteria bacterium]|nr:hypothetical protein [Gammaproteobacteria bacterium]
MKQIFVVLLFISTFGNAEESNFAIGLGVPYGTIGMQLSANISESSKGILGVGYGAYSVGYLAAFDDSEHQSHAWGVSVYRKTVFADISAVTYHYQYRPNGFNETGLVYGVDFLAGRIERNGNSIEKDAFLFFNVGYQF